jgi:hypothetical protein
MTPELAAAAADIAAEIPEMSHSALSFIFY